MANYEEWLEGAQQYGAPLEDRSAVPVVGESGIDNTASIPGVRYSGNPLTDSKAQPTGFIQLHLASLFGKIDGLSSQVSTAASGLGTLKQETEAARDSANAAAQSVNTAVQQASTAATAANTAATDASKVNAEISGMTVTITNRQGQSSSVNIGFEIYRTYASVSAMNADAANVPAGKFVIIATNDKTSADNAKLYSKNSQGGFTLLSDLDQASSEAWADWLNNMKPAIEGKITQAETDHGIAANDHTTASSDHTTAMSDHAASVAATTGAEKVNATLSGTTITVTDRNGKAVSANVKGDKGDDLHWEEMTQEEKEELAETVLNMLVFATEETSKSVVDELT